MNEELLNMVIKVILTIVSVAITTYIIPLIKSKINNNEYKELLTFIEKCVEAAEKLYTSEEWKEKKLYVLKLANEKLDALGIDVNDQELNALVEGFVKAIKG